MVIEGGDRRRVRMWGGLLAIGGRADWRRGGQGRVGRRREMGGRVECSSIGR